MKAVRIHRYGAADELVYEEAACPSLREDEVLIRVHAAGVNPFDCAVRSGYVAGSGYFQHTLPLILGADVSGVVESVGSGVTEFQPGDEVYTRVDLNRDGGYAEYVAVRASDVVSKPDSLDHVHAAALPHVSLTAWGTLYDTANLAPGQTVLIHGAAGGVGHIAVQLAKLRGAKVIGTASTDNLDFLRELGVDEAVDYTVGPFEDVVRDVDVVLDTIGGDCQERSWQVLKPGGLLMSIVHPPSAETAAACGVRQEFAMASFAVGPVLREIASLVNAGQLKPTVSAILPLDQVQRAHGMSESRRTRGKIVLQVV
jgi:NADPH:quinone reductase-like Zn-dependent oxidoreductase